MKDQSVRDSVREILESAQESDRQLPSIRAIRAKIGKGSLGTISEAVNEWKQEKLVQQGELPSGFEQREAENIIKAVWEAVAPMIRAQIEHASSSKNRTPNPKFPWVNPALRGMHREP